MKTKNLALFSLALLVSLSVFATRIPVLSIDTETENAVVTFESFKPTNFELTVKNEIGQILYYKQSDRASENYSMEYNFKKLGNGNYEVAMNFGSCCVLRAVKVVDGKVQLGDISRNCRPYFQFDDDKLKISFLNRMQEQLYLNVYQNGVHIEGVKLGKDLCIQKAIDISKLNKGNYEFIMSDAANNEYAFSFER